MRPVERAQKTRQTHVRLDSAAVQRLVAGYESGLIVRDLASTFGVRRQTVTTILLREGVTIRSVGLSEHQVLDACRLYRDGWSLVRIGDKLGVSAMTVRRRLLLRGVVMREPWDR